MLNKLYWQSVKAGQRTVNSLPTSVQEAIKAIAKEEVELGLISQETVDTIFNNPDKLFGQTY